MTDLELLIILKREFKAYLNSPIDKQPSLICMLDMIKFVKEIIIEDHKTRQKIENNDNKIDEREIDAKI